MTVQHVIDGAVGVVTLAKPPHNLFDDALLLGLMTAYEKVDKVVAQGARAILLPYFTTSHTLSRFWTRLSLLHGR
jgi:hypothetical protein